MFKFALVFGQVGFTEARSSWQYDFKVTPSWDRDVDDNDAIPRGVTFAAHPKNVKSNAQHPHQSLQKELDIQKKTKAFRQSYTPSPSAFDTSHKLFDKAGLHSPENEYMPFDSFSAKQPVAKHSGGRNAGPIHSDAENTHAKVPDAKRLKGKHPAAKHPYKSQVLDPAEPKLTQFNAIDALDDSFPPSNMADSQPPITSKTANETKVASHHGPIYVEVSEKNATTPTKRVHDRLNITRETILSRYTDVDGWHVGPFVHTKLKDQCLAAPNSCPDAAMSQVVKEVKHQQQEHEQKEINSKMKSKKFDKKREKWENTAPRDFARDQGLDLSLHSRIHAAAQQIVGKKIVESFRNHLIEAAKAKQHGSKVSDEAKTKSEWPSKTWPADSYHDKKFQQKKLQQDHLEPPEPEHLEPPEPFSLKALSQSVIFDRIFDGIFGRADGTDNSINGIDDSINGTDSNITVGHAQAVVTDPIFGTYAVPKLSPDGRVGGPFGGPLPGTTAKNSASRGVWGIGNPKPLINSPQDIDKIMGTWEDDAVRDGNIVWTQPDGTEESLAYFRVKNRTTTSTTDGPFGTTESSEADSEVIAPDITPAESSSTDTVTTAPDAASSESLSTTLAPDTASSSESTQAADTTSTAASTTTSPPITSAAASAAEDSGSNTKEASVDGSESNATVSDAKNTSSAEEEEGPGHRETGVDHAQPGEGVTLENWDTPWDEESDYPINASGINWHEIVLSGGSISLGEVLGQNISLTDPRIAGVDSIDRIEFVKVPENSSAIGVLLHFNEVALAGKESIGNIVSNVESEIVLRDVEVFLEFAVDLAWQKIVNLQVGQLSQDACIADLVESFEVHKMDMKIAEISVIAPVKLNIDGDMINQFVDSVLTEDLVNSINAAIGIQLEELKNEKCPRILEEVYQRSDFPHMDFKANPEALEVMKMIIDDTLSVDKDEDKYITINDLVNVLTGGNDGSLSLHNVARMVGSDRGGTWFELWLREIKVSGFDTFEDIEVNITGPKTLFQSIGLRKFNITAWFDLSRTENYQDESKAVTTVNDFAFSFALLGLKENGTITAEVSLPQGDALEVRQLIACEACTFYALKNVTFKDFALDLDTFKFSMLCPATPEPQDDSAGAVEQNYLNHVQNHPDVCESPILQRLSETLSDPDAQDQITRFVRKMIEFINKKYSSNTDPYVSTSSGFSDRDTSVSDSVDVINATEPVTSNSAQEDSSVSNASDTVNKTPSVSSSNGQPFTDGLNALVEGCLPGAAQNCENPEYLDENYGYNETVMNLFLGFFIGCAVVCFVAGAYGFFWTDLDDTPIKDESDDLFGNPDQNDNVTRFGQNEASVQSANDGAGFVGTNFSNNSLGSVGMEGVVHTNSMGTTGSIGQQPSGIGTNTSVRSQLGDAEDIVAYNSVTSMGTTGTARTTQQAVAAAATTGAVAAGSQSASTPVRGRMARVFGFRRASDTTDPDMPDLDPESPAAGLVANRIDQFEHLGDKPEHEPTEVEYDEIPEGTVANQVESIEAAQATATEDYTEGEDDMEAVVYDSSLREIQPAYSGQVNASAKSMMRPPSGVPQPEGVPESELPSLAFQVAHWLQIFVTFAIVGIICLFISSDYGWGTETVLDITAADQDIQLDLGKSTYSKTLQEFKKYNLDSMYWGQLLSHLVFPYISLSVLLIIWWIPNRWFPSYWRGMFLEFVYYFTKYTFGNIIIYIFIMCCVNFHISNDIQLSSFLALPGGFIKAELRVFPQYSIFCVLAGSALAQAISGVMLIVHRRCAAKARIEKDFRSAALSGVWLRTGGFAAPGAKYALCRHRFATQNEIDEPGGDRLVITTWGNIFMVLNILLPLAFIWPGIILNSYQIVAGGIFSHLIGDDQSHRHYSVWTSGTGILPDDLSDAPGTVVVFIWYIFRAIWLGILFVFSGLIIWFVPLSLRGHRALHAICEFCNAWHGIDVVVIFYILSIAPMGEYADAILADNASGLQVVLDAFRHMITDEADTEATSISVRFDWRFCFICIVAAWLVVGGNMFLFVSRQAIEDRTIGADKSGQSPPV